LHPARAVIPIAACLLAACATPRTTPTTGTTPTSRTFNAARNTLLDYGFRLDRVDAQAGVITTQPRTSAGLLAPWRADQGDAFDQTRELLSREGRTVRVQVTTDDAGLADASVVVAVSRTQRPGVRPQSKAIALTSQAYDPALAERAWSYEAPIRRDERLERELEREIARRASQFDR